MKEQTPTFTVNDFINDMKVEGEHIRTVFEGAIDKIHMKEAAEKIKGLIDIQKQNGNYNCNEYMYGMLIGLETAYYSLLGEEGKFTERPKEWLDDNIPKDFVPTVAEGCGHYRCYIVTNQAGNKDLFCSDCDAFIETVLSEENRDSLDEFTWNELKDNNLDTSS